MKAYGWFGLALLLASEVLLHLRVEPFRSWFYSFAWWSYILVADSLVLRLRGSSLLHDRRRELASMLPLSVFVWLLFEGCNLALRNWFYTGLPPQPWLRWPGYALAFATVLPGIFVTADLLDALLPGRRSGPAPSAAEPLGAGPHAGLPLGWMAFGAALTAASLLLPRYFFPAVWVGPIFLLDPMVERAGLRSLRSSPAGGGRSRIWPLACGGFACGLLWEFWNFWAGSKWIYSVPFVGHWKIFEMPVLGFLGFPPFALECWILYHWLRMRPARGRGLFWLAVAAYCVWALWSIDRHTLLQAAPAPHMEGA